MSQIINLRALIDEPLVHFTAIAALIFGLWSLWSNPDDRTVLTIPESDIRAYTERYEQSTGGRPSPEQLAQFRKNWIQEEVLYREGLARGLDRSDPAIRARIITKMQLMLAASTGDPTPSEQALRDHLEAHSERYVVPARFTYELATIGARAGDDPQTYVSALEDGADPRAAGLDINVYRDKPGAFIAASHGDPLENVLKMQVDSTGVWFPIKLKNGSQALARLKSYTPEHVPPVDRIRPRLTADWIKEQRVLNTEQQVSKLLAGYTVSETLLSDAQQ